MKAAEATIALVSKTNFGNTKNLSIKMPVTPELLLMRVCDTYARNVSLNIDEFESCLQSDRQVKVITDGRQYAQMLGVNVLHLLLQLTENWSIKNELREAVDAALAEASAN
jgi:hypothetical protein